jgi:hypothetical protein
MRLRASDDVGRFATTAASMEAAPTVKPRRMQEIGFTKARSNRALADAVEIRGGSITRVFARAEPLSLIDLVPLRDQVCLLEYASREIGDDALSARRRSEAGIPGLGVYGDRLLSAPRLEAAIARASLPCELSRGDVSAIIFPSELLELPSLCPGLADDAGIVEIETPVPDPRDIVKAPHRAGPARRPAAR